MASRSITSPVISRNFAKLLLEAIVPASVEEPLIVSPKIGLIVGTTLAISPDSVIGDFTAIQAAFTGYTTGGQAVVLDEPGVVRAGVRHQLLAGNCVWVLGTADPLVTASVTGAYLYDTTYGLIASGYFDEPAPLAAVGDYLDLFFGVPVILF